MANYRTIIDEYGIPNPYETGQQAYEQATEELYAHAPAVLPRQATLTELLRPGAQLLFDRYEAEAPAYTPPPAPEQEIPQTPLPQAPPTQQPLQALLPRAVRIVRQQPPAATPPAPPVPTEPQQQPAPPNLYEQSRQRYRQYLEHVNRLAAMEADTGKRSEYLARAVPSVVITPTALAFLSNHAGEYGDPYAYDETDRRREAAWVREPWKRLLGRIRYIQDRWMTGQATEQDFTGEPYPDGSIALTPDNILPYIDDLLDRLRRTNDTDIWERELAAIEHLATSQMMRGAPAAIINPLRQVMRELKPLLAQRRTREAAGLLGGIRDWFLTVAKSALIVPPTLVSDALSVGARLGHAVTGAESLRSAADTMAATSEFIREQAAPPAYVRGQPEELAFQAGAAIGQLAGQLATSGGITAVTQGAMRQIPALITTVGVQEAAQAVNEAVTTLRQERPDIDERQVSAAATAVGLAVGAINALIERVSGAADILRQPVLRAGLRSALQQIGTTAAHEGMTEAAQEAVQRIGHLVYSRGGWNRLDEAAIEVALNGLYGAIAGGTVHAVPNVGDALVRAIAGGIDRVRNALQRAPAAETSQPSAGEAAQQPAVQTPPTPPAAPPTETPAPPPTPPPGTPTTPTETPTGPATPPPAETPRPARVPPALEQKIRQGIEQAATSDRGMAVAGPLWIERAYWPQTKEPFIHVQIRRQHKDWLPAEGLLAVVDDPTTGSDLTYAAYSPDAAARLADAVLARYAAEGKALTGDGYRKRRAVPALVRARSVQLLAEARQQSTAAPTVPPAPAPAESVPAPSPQPAEVQTPAPPPEQPAPTVEPSALPVVPAAQQPQTGGTYAEGTGAETPARGPKEGLQGRPAEPVRVRDHDEAGLAPEAPQEQTVTPPPSGEAAENVQLPTETALVTPAPAAPETPTQQPARQPAQRPRRLRKQRTAAPPWPDDAPLTDVLTGISSTTPRAILLQGLKQLPQHTTHMLVVRRPEASIRIVYQGRTPTSEAHYAITGPENIIAPLLGAYGGRLSTEEVRRTISPRNVARVALKLPGDVTAADLRVMRINPPTARAAQAPLPPAPPVVPEPQAPATVKKGQPAPSPAEEATAPPSAAVEDRAAHAPPPEEQPAEQRPSEAAPVTEAQAPATATRTEAPERTTATLATASPRIIANIPAREALLAAMSTPDQTVPTSTQEQNAEPVIYDLLTALEYITSWLDRGADYTLEIPSPITGVSIRCDPPVNTIVTYRIDLYLPRTEQYFDLLRNNHLLHTLFNATTIQQTDTYILVQLSGQFHRSTPNGILPAIAAFHDLLQRNEDLRFAVALYNAALNKNPPGMKIDYGKGDLKILRGATNTAVILVTVTAQDTDLRNQIATAATGIIPDILVTTRTADKALLLRHYWHVNAGPAITDQLRRLEAAIRTQLAAHGLKIREGSTPGLARVALAAVERQTGKLLPEVVVNLETRRTAPDESTVHTYARALRTVLTQQADQLQQLLSEIIKEKPEDYGPRTYCVPGWPVQVTLEYAHDARIFNVKITIPFANTDEQYTLIALHPVLSNIGGNALISRGANNKYGLWSVRMQLKPNQVDILVRTLADVLDALLTLPEVRYAATLLAAHLWRHESEINYGPVRLAAEPAANRAQISIRASDPRAEEGVKEARAVSVPIGKVAYYDSDVPTLAPQCAAFEEALAKWCKEHNLPLFGSYAPGAVQRALAMPAVPALPSMPASEPAVAALLANLPEDEKTDLSTALKDTMDWWRHQVAVVPFSPRVAVGSRAATLLTKWGVWLTVKKTADRSADVSLEVAVPLDYVDTLAKEPLFGPKKLNATITRHKGYALLTIQFEQTPTNMRSVGPRVKSFLGRIGVDQRLHYHASIWATILHGQEARIDYETGKWQLLITPKPYAKSLTLQYVVLDKPEDYPAIEIIRDVLHQYYGARLDEESLTVRFDYSEAEEAILRAIAVEDAIRGRLMTATGAPGRHFRRGMASPDFFLWPVHLMHWLWRKLRRLLTGTTPPEDSKFRFEREEVEQRYRAAFGLRPPPVIQRLLDAVTTIGRQVTRIFPAIPHTAQFAVAIDELTRMREHRSLAAQVAIDNISHILGLDSKQALTADQVDLFTRIIVLDDLVETVAMAREHDLAIEKLPFGFTLSEIHDEQARLRIALNKPEYAAVRAAIDRRDGVWKQLRDCYVQIMAALGIPTKHLFKRQHYFRHMVLAYARLRNEPTYGTRAGKLPGFRSWRQRRGISELDYNTHYLEAEFEVMSQMLLDTLTGTSLKRLLDTYNLRPKLERLAEQERRRTGNDNINWTSFVPKDYTITSISDALPLHQVFTIPKRMAEQAFEAALQDLNIPVQKIRAAIAMHQKEKIVLPTPIVRTLAHFWSTPAAGFAEMASRTSARVHSFLKRFYLLGPHKIIKYFLRNLTGDLDAVLAFCPGALREVPDSITELTHYWRTGTTTPLLAEWIRAGGFQQLQSVVELPTLQQTARWRQLGLGQVPDLPAPLRAGRNLWKGYWHIATQMNNYREALLRYSAYRYYRKQIDKYGGDVRQMAAHIGWGAAKPEMVWPLKDPVLQASLLANSALGAYDRTGNANQVLRRHVFLFSSFQEANLRRYLRGIANCWRSDLAAQAGMTLIERLGLAGRITAMGTVRLGIFAIKASLLFTFLHILNHMLFPDEERELPEDVRSRLHLVYGRDADGNVRVLTNIGALDDLLSWLDLDRTDQHVSDLLNNRRPLRHILRDVALAPANKTINQLSPVVTVLPQAITRQRWYPRPAHAMLGVERLPQIHDAVLEAMRNVGFEDEYRWLTRQNLGLKPLPRRRTADILLDLISAGANPDESAYWLVQERKRRFLERYGISTGYGWQHAARTQALYWLRQSIRHGDVASALYHLNDYIAAGGTRDGLTTSIRNMHPLHGIPESLRSAFLDEIRSQDGLKIDMAVRYWQTQIADLEDALAQLRTMHAQKN